MRLDALQTAQREYFANYMDGLARACRDKYLQAARLMEVESIAVNQVRELTQDGPIGLYYLLPAYSILCARYNERFFSPQENLFKNPSQEQDARWARYFWSRLTPRLLESDEIVRNVLRAVRGIPCADQRAASDALKQSATDCLLPNYDEFRINMEEFA